MRRTTSERGQPWPPPQGRFVCDGCLYILDLKAKKAPLTNRVYGFTGNKPPTMVHPIRLSLRETKAGHEDNANLKIPLSSWRGFSFELFLDCTDPVLYSPGSIRVNAYTHVP